MVMSFKDCLLWTPTLYDMLLPHSSGFKKKTQVLNSPAQVQGSFKVKGCI